VTQFHAERDGKVITSQSLGKFNARATQEYNDRVVQKKDTVQTTQPKPAYVQLFDRGQLCEDTGKGRQTRVEFHCCAVSSTKGSSRNDASVTFLEEPSTCSYTMKICTIYACKEGEEPQKKNKQQKGGGKSSKNGEGSTAEGASASSSSSSPSSNSMTSLLAPLRQSCFRLQDGWWMYELCVESHLRQFHLQESKEKGGKHELVQIHMLGKAETTVGTVFDGHDEQNMFVREGDMVAFEHVYTSGDHCDLAGKKRQAAIRFVCAGSDLTTSKLMKVEETETCRYTAVFHTPYLCQHPSFSKEVERTVVMTCQELQEV